MKKRTLSLITALSLVTISRLVSRDNGIGLRPKSPDELNKVIGMRKAIVEDNIYKLVKDSEDVTLKSNSFLRVITDENLIDKNFGTYPDKLAVLVEKELSFVKETVLPTIVDITTEISDIVAETALPNLQSQYNFKFVRSSGILGALATTELVAWREQPFIPLTPSDVSLDSIEKFEDIESIIYTGNAIVDDGITVLLERKSKSEWCSVYNSVFSDFSKIGYVERFADNGLEYLDEAIFTYLVTRKYAEGTPYQAKGSADVVKSTMIRLNNHLKQLLVNRYYTLEKAKNDKILILSKQGDYTLINKSVMNELDISIEVLIGAIMDGYVNALDIKEDENRLMDMFAEANNLFILKEKAALNGKIKVAIMKVVDDKIDIMLNDESSRRLVSDMVFDLPDTGDINIRDVVTSILLEYKYTDSNVKYIFNKMREVIQATNSQGDSELNFNTAAEYVALDLISRYLITTHLEIK